MSQPPDPTLPTPDAGGDASPAETEGESTGPGHPDDSSQGGGTLPPSGSGSGQAGGFDQAGGSGQAGGFGQAGTFGAPGTSPALFDGPAPVLVSFAPPTRQNRLTIAFRGLLAIPHLIILYALGFAAGAVAFIGWFAALFTGRLPEWAHTFITGVVRWQVRVYAYILFLTDAYPPFSFEDDPYPVRLVTARARLNQAAVLFRLILIIPASFVIGVAFYGLGVLAFFFWLIALVAGRLPDSLHQAIAATLRAQARLYCYFYMVTGVYPWWGLYGDHVPVPAAASGSGADADTTPTAPADPWLLPLSAVAEGLVWLFQVIGLAAVIVIAVVLPSVGGPGQTLSNAESLVQVNEAYSQATSSTRAFSQAVQACGELSCVTAQVQKEATTLQTLASSVRSAGMVGQPGADASKLASDATSAAQALDQLATATTVSQYQSDVARTGVEQKLNSIDSDYRKLVRDMGV